MNYQLAAFADEASASLEGQIAAMQENDIAMLEIRGVDGKNIADLTLEEAKEIRKRLADAGLRVWSLGSPYGKISMKDPFGPHLDLFRHGLELCDQLGADHIRLFSFYDAAGCREEVFDRLGQFIDAADGSGILLCHENEKGIYGDIASRCLEIHQAFPKLRAVFDPANFIQCGQDTMEAWNLLAPYVNYMHIKDALADGSVVPAGKGIGNLPWLLERYQGEVLTIEPHLSVFAGLDKLEEREKSVINPYTYPDSQAAFKAAADALKALI